MLRRGRRTRSCLSSFNLDSSVGYRGANSSHDDILPVQFLLNALSMRMTTAAGKVIQPILAQTPQTGVVDQATAGRVAVAKGALGRKLLRVGLDLPTRPS